MGLLDVFLPTDGVDFRATYIEEGGRQGYLVFTREGVEFHADFSMKPVTQIASSEIADVNVYEDEQETRRFTFTRLLFFHRFALAMPKHEKQVATQVVLVLSSGEECTFTIADKAAATVWSAVESYVEGYGGATE